MRWLRKCLVVAFVVPAVLAPWGAAFAVDEPIREVPVAVTAFDRAALDAIEQARDVTADWLPVGASANTEPPSGTRLLGVGAASFAFDDFGLFDLDRMEVLRGPQGMLFGSDRTAVGNPPTAEYYGTRPEATVVVAEVAGWPPRDLSELFELALAFTWTGDEVLEESPYPGDPLRGLGNVSSFGWIADNPFVNYATIQSGVWTPYADPLLRFDTTTTDDRHFIGWMLPGVPDALSLAISYSPDATIDSMIAQRVDVPVQDDIAQYPLIVDFDTLDAPLQASIRSLFVESADPAPTEGEDPVPTDGDETPPPSSDAGAGGEQGPTGDTTGAVSGDTGTAAEGDPNQAAGGTDDEAGGGINPLLFIGIPIVGGFAWLLYRWLFGGRGTQPVTPVPPGATAGDPHPPPTGNEAAFRTHAGPSQAMTASEEALGIADAMVGVVVDGWHLLPWDVGSDFFIPAGQTKTYRTIPVVDKDVATDVEFLGKPAGFETDSNRFGYWMNDDGVLKIGSPTDPHAFPLEPGAPPLDPGPAPLESMLPAPGPGESLEDIFVERILRAHELTGGAHPVDGWIAPSNEARTVGMLSDDGGRSACDPEAWSGHFINVDTGEWLHPGQLGYDDMMRKLAVQPPRQPAKPIESTDLFDLDDTPGTL